MVAALELFGLAWQRPAGALALAVPLVVWLLAMRRGRAQEVWTGSLEAWREAGASEPLRQRQARRPPLAVALLVAALVAGAVALAGPRSPLAASARTWTVVVDRSPSMYLTWRVDGGTGEARITRLERALELAHEVLAGVRSEGDRVVWLAYEDGAPQQAPSPDLPPRWRVAPRVPQPAPPWSAHDDEGTVWLSDATPEPAPRRAGVALAGGGAVAGAVAALGTTRVVWDGERLEEREDLGPRPLVFLAPAAAGAVERVTRAWAEARGCAVVARPESALVLEVAVDVGLPGPDGGNLTTASTGRDGWTWEVDLAGSFHPRGEVWLAEGESRSPVVAWVPGRITLAPGRYSREPDGDPADFALSWAELLDDAALAPPDVVPLAERGAAGAAQSRAPAPRAGPFEPARGGSLEAGLAAVAAALALLACLQGRR